MELNIVTPWPHDLSGIAEYSYSLAHELSPFYTNIYIISSCQNPLEPYVSNIHLVDNLKPDVHTLHMFGNNSQYHLLNLRTYRPGHVIHIHDLSLHHILAQLTLDKPYQYYQLLSKLYGRDITSKVLHYHVTSPFRYWDNPLPEIGPITFLEPAISTAKSLIINSLYSQSRLQNILSHIPKSPPVHYVPQTYTLPPPPPCNRSKCILIGIFGHISPSKKVKEILTAFLESIPSIPKYSMKLRLVAPNLSSIAELDAYQALLCQPDYFEIVDSPTIDELNLCIAECHYTFSLRNPTVGETSAIAAKCRMYGIHLILFPLGSFSEFSDIATFLSPDDPLIPQLIRFFTDPMTLNPPRYPQLFRTPDHILHSYINAVHAQ